MSEAIDFSKIREPFLPQDLEWRVGESGKKGEKIWAKCFCYVTNRAIQNRLDEAVGPANWKNEFTAGPGGGVLCGLSIRIEGEWVTKYDGAENTDFEAIKGGLSDAMKRAAVQWGIGRYLYDLDEGWANIHANGARYTKLPEKKGGDSFKWDPPALPAWALPSGYVPGTTKIEQPKPAAQAAVDHDANGEVTTPLWDRIGVLYRQLHRDNKHWKTAFSEVLGRAITAKSDVSADDIRRVIAHLEGEHARLCAATP